MAKNNGNAEYRRALGLIDIGVQHALSGNFDTARTVLSAAFNDGALQKPGRMNGRLQHVAAVTLVNLLERRDTLDNIANTLRKVLRDLRQVPQKERQFVVARCVQVMMYLPHVKEIRKALAKAKKAHLRKDYVEAFTQIRAAKNIRTRYHDLTPVEVVEEITTAGNVAMTHLMQSNSPAQVMEIVNDLTARGLIET